MKNLWAIKPFEEENYYSNYKKRNLKKVIIEEKFPNINKDNKHIKNYSIQFPNSYFQKYFKQISIPKNQNLIIDKNSENKRKYTHKNFLLSMKYFIFLRQENLTDDLIDQLNTSNDVLLNDENYIKGKIKVKEKIKKQMKKYNFEQQLELLMELNNIPNNILDKTANYIIETIKNQKVEKLETERPKFIIHNVYFDWILFSIFHKIEIKNQYNDSIKKEYVINLLQNEIKNIQDNIVECIEKNLKTKQDDIENFNNSDFELFMTLKKKYQLNDEVKLNELYYKKNTNNTLEQKESMLLKQIIQKKTKGKIKFPSENLANTMKNYNIGRNNLLNQNDSSLKLNDNQNLKYKDISTNTNINYNTNNKTHDNPFNSLTNNNFYLNKLKNKNISNIINNGNTENHFNNMNYKTISTISRNENKNTKINLTDGWNSYRNTYSNSLFDTKRPTNTNNYTIKNEEDDNKNISIYENGNELNKNLLINKFSNNNISQNKIKKKENTLNDLIHDKIDFDISDDKKIKNTKYIKRINKKEFQNNEKNGIKDEIESEEEYENNYKKSADKTDAEFNDFVKRDFLKNNEENHNKNLNNNLIQTVDKRKNMKGIKQRNRNIFPNNTDINNFININDTNEKLSEEQLKENNTKSDNNNNYNNNNNNNEKYNNENYNIENFNNNYYNENQSNNINNLISNSSLSHRKSSLNNNLLSRKSFQINKEIRRNSLIQQIKYLDSNLFEKKENFEDESEEEEYNEEEDEEEKVNKNINQNKNKTFKKEIENNTKKEIKYSPKKSQELKINKEEEERKRLEKIRLLKQKEMENFINSKRKQNLIKLDNNPYTNYSNNMKKNTLEQNQFLRKIYFKNMNFLKEKSKKITIYEEEKIKNLPVEEIKKENEKIIKVAIENENMRKLIYDNSYLFKNKNDLYDNEIRNNINDIINGNYEIKEIKKEEKVIKNVVHSPIKKKKLPKQYIFQKDGLKIYLNYDLNKEDENDIMKKNLEQKKIEEEKSKNTIPHEIRLKNFFDKIKKLKESNFDKFDEEIDELLQQQINDSEFGKNKKRELNLKKFSLTLNDFRTSNENIRKIKIDNLRFISPCIFSMEKKK